MLVVAGVYKGMTRNPDTSVYGRRYTFSDDSIREAVKQATCVVDVLKILGARMTSGASHVHISKRIKTLGLDISHFHSARGRITTGRPQPKRRKTSEDILVLMPKGTPRTPRSMLHRCLLSSGVPEQCSTPQCQVVTTWLDKPIKLHIDHKNGNSLDNRLDNLRFLCPNCHTQTPTFGYHGRCPSSRSVKPWL